MAGPRRLSLPARRCDNRGGGAHASGWNRAPGGGSRIHCRIRSWVCARTGSGRRSRRASGVLLASSRSVRLLDGRSSEVLRRNAQPDVWMRLTSDRHDHRRRLGADPRTHGVPRTLILSNNFPFTLGSTDPSSRKYGDRGWPSAWKTRSIPSRATVRGWRMRSSCRAGILN